MKKQFGLTFSGVLFVLSASTSSFFTLNFESIAYVLNNTKQPNVAAIAWKEQLFFRSLYGPFITAKNDWDATPTKIGFAMNNSAPEIIIQDYSSTDGYNGKTLVDNTKPDEINLNWRYLSADDDTKRRSTSGHELGHALGLDHTANTALMNDKRDRAAVYTPMTEDINGIKAVYP
jgi:Matrixin